MRVLLPIASLFALLLPAQAPGLEPLPKSCEFDPHVLTCFFPYETDLRDFHHDQLDAIADEVKRSFAGKRPRNEILLVGHASTFKSTDPVQKNARDRALAARNALVKRLEARGLPMDEIDVITTGAGDDEPRFSNGSREGRAYNRRVELTLTHVPAKEEPEPEPRGKKVPALVFSKNATKEPKTGLSVPSDMPPVRFPKGFKGCSKRQRSEVEAAWARAHYYMWRADQVMDWLDAHPKHRAAAWHRGAPKKMGDTENPSPRNWFGPYERRRFENVDTAIEKVFSKRFLGRTFKATCKKQPKKSPGLLAEHSVFGHVVFYDHFFTKMASFQALTAVHEIYHGLVLRNGTWVMDTHVLCGKDLGKRCQTSKHYGEADSLRLSWGGKPRRHRLAIRNNDNHAYFAKNQGEAIRSGKLVRFPPK